MIATLTIKTTKGTFTIKLEGPSALSNAHQWLAQYEPCGLVAASIQPHGFARTWYWGAWRRSLTMDPKETGSVDQDTIDRIIRETLTLVWDALSVGLERVAYRGPKGSIDWAWHCVITMPRRSAIGSKLPGTETESGHGEHPSAAVDAAIRNVGYAQQLRAEAKAKAKTSRKA